MQIILQTHSGRLLFIRLRYIFPLTNDSSNFSKQNRRESASGPRMGNCHNFTRTFLPPTRKTDREKERERKRMARRKASPWRGGINILSPPIINRWHRDRVESKNSRISRRCVPRARRDAGSAESNSSPRTRAPGSGGEGGSMECRMERRVASWVDVFSGRYISVECAHTHRRERTNERTNERAGGRRRTREWQREDGGGGGGGGS